MGGTSQKKKKTENEKMRILKTYILVTKISEVRIVME